MPMVSPLVQSILDSNNSTDISSSNLHSANENDTNSIAPMSAPHHQSSKSQIPLESTGNFANVNKLKEAMYPNFELKTTNVPETQKLNLKQKRLMPNSLVGKPGMDSVEQSMYAVLTNETLDDFSRSSQHAVSSIINNFDNTDIFSNTMLNGEIDSIPINVSSSNTASGINTSVDIVQATALNTENSSVDSDYSVLSNTSMSFTIDHIHDISGDNIAGNFDATAANNVDACSSPDVLHELYLSNIPIDITETDLINYIHSRALLIRKKLN